MTLAWLVCFPAMGEPTISLEDAAARKAPDFTPLYQDRVVVVTGQVSIKPVRITNYLHVAIEERQHGLVLEGTGSMFDSLSPGDWVEARGRISQRAGLPVVVVSTIATVSSGAPPLAVAVRPGDVQNLRRLGQLVLTEGPVIEVGSNFGGAYMRMGDYANALKVFLPSSANEHRSFAGFAIGDIVRVTGVAYQYCPLPPHLAQFELLISDGKDAVRVNRSRLPQ